MRHKPWYNSNANFDTNSKSFFDYLARSNKFLETLIEDYEVFKEIIVEEMKQSKFDAEMSVEDILLNWLDDGTLERIINDEVFGNKADQSWVQAELSNMRTYVTQQDEWYNLKLSNVLSIQEYGADASGNSDSLSAFKQAFEELSNHGTLVLEENATYRLSDMLQVESNKDITIIGNGAKIHSEVSGNNFDTSRALNFRGVYKGATSLAGGAERGNSEIRVAHTQDIRIGDIIHVQSNEQFNSTRSYYKKGGTFEVTRIMGNTLTINGSFPYNIGDNALVNVYDPVTVKISDLSIEGMNPLPAGYYGLLVEYSKNSVLSHIESDNFNHCISFRTHVDTEVNHTNTYRSYFQGATEAYGFSSYTGTGLTINHSNFTSGRHGVDVSGFENSFRTTFNNVTAKSEIDGVSMNLHQASFDIVLNNCTFDSVGLANHVTMNNCLIGNQTATSRFKSGESYNHVKYVFNDCTFIGDHVFQTTDDAQNQNNTANRMGLIKFSNATVHGRLQLNLGTGYNPMRTDHVVIRDSNNININQGEGNVINKVTYDNIIFDTLSNMVTGDGSVRIFSLNNSNIIERYSLISLNQFDIVFLENVNVRSSDGESNGRMYLNSKNTSGDNQGIVHVINSDLRLLPIHTGGFQELNIVNSQVAFTYGENNVTRIYDTRGTLRE